MKGEEGFDGVPGRTGPPGKDVSPLGLLATCALNRKYVRKMTGKTCNLMNLESMRGK